MDNHRPVFNTFQSKIGSGLLGVVLILKHSQGL